MNPDEAVRQLTADLENDLTLGRLMKEYRQVGLQLITLGLEIKTKYGIKLPGVKADKCDVTVFDNNIDDLVED